MIALPYAPKNLRSVWKGDHAVIYINVSYLYLFLFLFLSSYGLNSTTLLSRSCHLHHCVVSVHTEIVQELSTVVYISVSYLYQNCLGAVIYISVLYLYRNCLEAVIYISVRICTASESRAIYPTPPAADGRESIHSGKSIIYLYKLKIEQELFYNQFPIRNRKLDMIF